MGITQTVNNFRDKPVSFFWAQAGDHPEVQNMFNLQSGFPLVLLINPMRRIFSIMKSGYTEENLEEWLKDILNRKGGRKFGHYSKELAFDAIEVQEEAAVAEDDVEINEENFDAEL